MNQLISLVINFYQNKYYKKINIYYEQKKKEVRESPCLGILNSTAFPIIETDASL